MSGKCTDALWNNVADVAYTMCMRGMTLAYVSIKSPLIKFIKLIIRQPTLSIFINKSF